jgi:hypothetical protein
MDTNKELAEALSEAERVFGTLSTMKADDETQQLKQPEEHQKLEEPEQVELPEVLTEEEVELLVDTEDQATVETALDQPWPDDIQVMSKEERADLAQIMADAEDDGVISSSVVPYREIATVLQSSDRPTIREKYVFRTQTGNKRRPIPAHKRWMQRLAEGHSR